MGSEGGGINGGERGGFGEEKIRGWEVGRDMGFPVTNQGSFGCEGI